MSDKLPVVGARQLVKFFAHYGFVEKGQKGSHISMKKTSIARRLVIPDKNTVSIGVVLSNLKTAGISREEFVRHFRRH